MPRSTILTRHDREPAARHSGTEAACRTPAGKGADFDALYRTFADSWRVSDDETLFDYLSGATTRNFTDRSFPDREIGAADLPNRATAEAICRRAGVTDPVPLAGCTLDVGLTGETAYADAAARLQRAGSSSQATDLHVDTPGGQARMSFPGSAGQKVFVDVPASTAPDRCFALDLLDPSENLVGAGCIVGGSGFIETATLSTAGNYAVVVRPDVPSQASVRVLTVTDQTLAIAPGRPVIAQIDQPGAVSDITFNGAAGQRVSLSLENTTPPDDCTPLTLHDDSGTVVADGCITGGRGSVDGAVLPRAGRYHFVVDPRGPVTGGGEVTAAFS